MIYKRGWLLNFDSIFQFYKIDFFFLLCFPVKIFIFFTWDSLFEKRLFQKLSNLFSNFQISNFQGILLIRKGFLYTWSLKLIILYCLKLSIHVERSYFIKSNSFNLVFFVKFKICWIKEPFFYDKIDYYSNILI